MTLRVCSTLRFIHVLGIYFRHLIEKKKMGTDQVRRFILILAESYKSSVRIFLHSQWLDYNIISTIIVYYAYFQIYT